MTAALQRVLVSPEETQEGKNACRLAAISLQPLPTVSPREAQEGKSAGHQPGPGQLRCA